MGRQRPCRSSADKLEPTCRTVTQTPDRGRNRFLYERLRVSRTLPSPHFPRFSTQFCSQTAPFLHSCGSYNQSAFRQNGILKCLSISTTLLELSLTEEMNDQRYETVLAEGKSLIFCTAFRTSRNCSKNLREKVVRFQSVSGAVESSRICRRMPRTAALGVYFRGA